jgi:Arc/MetJ family transcription regulator
LQSFFEPTNHETVRRLRAINRAPEAVKDAYREGRISQTLAAKLGPAQPSPDAAAVIAEIAQEIRKVPERKAVDAIVRTKLGQPLPTKLEKARKAVDALSKDELRALAAYLQSRLEGAE